MEVVDISAVVGDLSVVRGGFGERESAVVSWTRDGGW